MARVIHRRKRVEEREAGCGHTIHDGQASVQRHDGKHWLHSYNRSHRRNLLCSGATVFGYHHEAHAGSKHAHLHETRFCGSSSGGRGVAVAHSIHKMKGRGDQLSVALCLYGDHLRGHSLDRLVRDGNDRAVFGDAGLRRPGQNLVAHREGHALVHDDRIVIGTISTTLTRSQRGKRQAVRIVVVVHSKEGAVDREDEIQGRRAPVAQHHEEGLGEGLVGHHRELNRPTGLGLDGLAALAIAVLHFQQEVGVVRAPIDHDIEAVGAKLVQSEAAGREVRQDGVGGANGGLIAGFELQRDRIGQRQIVLKPPRRLRRCGRS
eukprot:scaffold2394_cov276-Pinguiococcus_pyrenoidosus.AAC.7